MRCATLFATALPFMAAMVDAATMTVQVGANAANAYTPSYVMAAAGDVINFQFVSDNHTATQSTFATPCMKMANGADSGFQPTANAAQVLMYNYTVTNTSPVWFYCQQGTHCKEGMVFAVNPTTAQPYGTFMNNAMGITGTTPGTSPSMAATPTPTAKSGAAASYGTNGPALLVTLFGLVTGLVL